MKFLEHLFIPPADRHQNREFCSNLIDLASNRRVFEQIADGNSISAFNSGATHSKKRAARRHAIATNIRLDCPIHMTDIHVVIDAQDAERLEDVQAALKIVERLAGRRPGHPPRARWQQSDTNQAAAIAAKAINSFLTTSEIQN